MTKRKIRKLPRFVKIPVWYIENKLRTRRVLDVAEMVNSLETRIAELRTYYGVE
jgi:hypothetical protein